jgi:hypothetical protein
MASSVSELGTKRSGDFDSKASLANPARPDQRHEPRIGSKQIADRIDFSFAPDE